jgi:hypothetical protein
VIVEYCRQHGLLYRQTGYWAAWREVLAHGRRMATFARAHAALEAYRRELA